MNTLMNRCCTVVLALFLTVSLTACGGDASSSNAQSNQAHTHEDGSTHSHGDRTHTHTDTSKTRLDTSGMTSTADSTAGHDPDGGDHSHGDSTHSHDGEEHSHQ